MRGKTVLLVLSFLTSIVCSGTGTDEVKRINALVAAIDDSLKTEHYAEFTIAEQGLSEGIPPGFTFYYDRDHGRLAAAVVSVGHETWSNEFRYYFYPDGKPMKYTKATIGRPDNPEKTAIIFDKQGKIVWKNVEEPQVAIETLASLFKNLQETRKKFAEY
jgi:hypothetical protein